MSDDINRQQLDLARRAATEGDWRAVSARCIGVLKSEPQRAEAHTLLGLAALEGGRPQIAVRAFKAALRADAEFGEARVYLARILAANGQFAAAESEAALCLPQIAGNPELLDMLATIYSRLGRQQQALSLYRQALQLAPDNIGILVNAAAVQLFLGRSADAGIALRRVLERAPDHYRAHWLLAKSRRGNHTETRAHLEALQALAGTAPPVAQPYLHYAAGKLSEDLRDWDCAWQHYQAGADAQRQRLHYDTESERETFNAVHEHLGESWYHRTGDHSPPTSGGETPIFIVGLPRAGSTLVEQILGSHAQVQALGELVQWPVAVKQQLGRGEAALLSPADARAIATRSPAGLGRIYLQSIRHLRNERRCFTDKLPGNFLYLPLIARALPGARFVHVRRNPMDAGLATYKQLFADAYPWSYDLEELGHYYVQYHQLMQQWQALLSGRIYTIDYDLLVAEPERETRSLLDWLQLPFERACLEFHRAGLTAATASATQVREPIHQRASGRWQLFAEQLQPYRAILENAGILPPDS
ncbi:sulfotransferase [Microbulbifer sp. ALW1]|uniref:tetratricopeptide repeat-containing sulfotransferase family protein n=1 Tax=Microbulbifer sp. (strain ALW1) TaxID=1516059 RepID=UPI00135B1373|nr:sulfotransferase [Microbulbifer sp. ALW1]